MNLKLMWACYDLYRKVQQVPQETFMDLGWKTITGAILVGLGYAAKALVGVLPEVKELDEERRKGFSDLFKTADTSLTLLGKQITKALAKLEKFK